MSNEDLKRDIEKFGIDFDARVEGIRAFMERLLRSGVSPASASLEGYRYTEIIVDAFDFNIPSKGLRKDISALLLEAAVKRLGIHSEQLRRIETKGYRQIT